ncbi:MAG: serine hydrolase domain-containing protein [Candidatus Hodarchaeota archaeon]
MAERDDLGRKEDDIRIKLAQHELGKQILDLIDYMIQGDYQWLNEFIQRRFSKLQEKSESGSFSSIDKLKFLFRANLQEKIRIIRLRQYLETGVAVDCKGIANELLFSIKLASTPESTQELVDVSVSFPKASENLKIESIFHFEDVSKDLERYLTTLEERGLFSGGVLIAKDEVPIFTKVGGEACKRYQIRNNLETKFNLASMTKIFTSIAIMQLYEQGKLDVHDTINKNIPSFPEAEKITVHYLLTHTSGLGSLWNRKFEQSWTKLRTIDDFIGLFAEDALLFPPGQKDHYSNTGYILLGKIIEVITGKSYFEHVKQSIYEPANMVNTDAFEMDKEVPNLAIGYTHYNYLDEFDPSESERRNNLFRCPIKGDSAGSGYSTLSDLLKFANALQKGYLLSQEYLDLATRPYVGTRQNGYGYGIKIGELSGFMFYGHGGGAEGVGTDLMIIPEAGITVVILTNYDFLYTELLVKKKLAKLLQELLHSKSSCPENDHRTRRGS